MNALSGKSPEEHGLSDDASDALEFFGVRSISAVETHQFDGHDLLVLDGDVQGKSATIVLLVGRKSDLPNFDIVGDQPTTLIRPFCPEPVGCLIVLALFLVILLIAFLFDKVAAIQSKEPQHLRRFRKQYGVLFANHAAGELVIRMILGDDGITYLGQNPGWMVRGRGGHLLLWKGTGPSCSREELRNNAQVICRFCLQARSIVSAQALVR